MRNMRYFCTVKLIGHIFTLLVVAVIMLNVSEIHASAINRADTTGLDSVKISLLTCSPGGEVYSLYGHTAIRYTDYRRDIDVAVNYGIFSFSKPFFVVRFIFGITDYEMGIVPFDYFCMEYESEGRSVYQQELNLTRAEKAAIRDAIDVNYLPQNRTYRYNYFYDNCTTRARDMLLGHMSRAVSYPGGKESYPSYRDLIHLYNKDHPWARFGNDILLGLKADMPTSLGEHQFLPFFLKEDFDKAVIANPDGTRTPLVVSDTCVVSCPAVAAGGGFPLRPLACAWIIFAVVAAFVVLEAVLKTKMWAFDAVLMVVCGCMGLVIFMMFFSEHPATSTNLQILLLNPLPLFFVYRTAKRAKNRRADKFWKWAVVAVILFFIGGFFQQYAEGMYVLALSLLARCVWNIVYEKKYLSV